MLWEPDVVQTAAVWMFVESDSLETGSHFKLAARDASRRECFWKGSRYRHYVPISLL